MTKTLSEMKLDRYTRLYGEQSPESAAAHYQHSRELHLSMDVFDPATKRVCQQASDYFEMAVLLFTKRGGVYPAYLVYTHTPSTARVNQLIELAWIADAGYMVGTTPQQHFLNPTDKTDRVTLENLLRDERYDFHRIPLCLLPMEMIQS